MQLGSVGLDEFRGDIVTLARPPRLHTTETPVNSSLVRRTFFFLSLLTLILIHLTTHRQKQRWYPLSGEAECIWVLTFKYKFLCRGIKAAELQPGCSFTKCLHGLLCTQEQSPEDILQKQNRFAPSRRSPVVGCSYLRRGSSTFLGITCRLLTLSLEALRWDLVLWSLM